MNNRKQFFDFTAEDRQRMVDVEKRSHREHVSQALDDIREAVTAQNAMLLGVLWGRNSNAEAAQSKMRASK